MANTRMRDFYDIVILTSGIYREPDYDILRNALIATAEQRGSISLLERRIEIMNQIITDLDVQGYWAEYQNSYDYAAVYVFEDVIKAVNELFSKINM